MYLVKGKSTLTYLYILGCNLSCMVTNDKEYLGQDKIDQFDALIFKIRFFKTDKNGNIIKV